MDVSKVLMALRQEREQIEEVIASLERLELSRERHRGRPPAVLGLTRKRGRPLGSKNKSPLRSAHRSNAAQAPLERAPRVMAAGQGAMPEDTAVPTELM